MRSLGFGDDDYSGSVVDVLLKIVKKDPENLSKIQGYLDRKFGDSSLYISAQPSDRRVTFSPSVFNVPKLEPRKDLVAIMMPFKGFDSVHSTIKGACTDSGLESGPARIAG